jgi:hypothetical protein
MQSVQDLQKKIEEYEKRMGIGEYDPAKEGYLVLVNILTQQNEFLKEFKIKNKIASDEKADVISYKNAKDLWENLPKMIESVSNLKISLKMEGEEKKKYYTPISAKEIANSNV